MSRQDKLHYVNVEMSQSIVSEWAQYMNTGSPHFRLTRQKESHSSASPVMLSARLNCPIYDKSLYSMSDSADHAHNEYLPATQAVSIQPYYKLK